MDGKCQEKLKSFGHEVFVEAHSLLLTNNFPPPPLLPFSLQQMRIFFLARIFFLSPSHFNLSVPGRWEAKRRIPPPHTPALPTLPREGQDFPSSLLVGLAGQRQGTCLLPRAGTIPFGSAEHVQKLPSGRGKDAQPMLPG